MVLASFLLAVSAAAASPATVEVLPDLVVRLRAARYFPSDDELRWEGWLGAGAGLVRVRGVTAYFTADIETIIGSQRRTFDANQVNYHLEAGLRRRVAGGDAALYFNHVSRHYSDREKEQAVDWNELGVRYARVLSGGPRPVAVTASIGHTTLASLVGYEWIATAELDAIPAKIGAAAGLPARGRARGEHRSRPRAAPRELRGRVRGGRPALVPGRPRPRPFCRRGAAQRRLPGAARRPRADAHRLPDQLLTVIAGRAAQAHGITLAS